LERGYTEPLTLLKQSAGRESLNSIVMKRRLQTILRLGRSQLTDLAASQGADDRQPTAWRRMA
jgi:hypothetical protein